MKARKEFAAVGLILAMVFTVNAQSSTDPLYTYKSDKLAFTISTCQTLDGGTLLGGVSLESGNSDYIVVRIDEAGHTLWTQTYGGDKEDELTAVKATQDGGFIIGGRSNSSISGNKTEYALGEYDLWVVKINADGLVEWDRTFGGAEKDNLVAIEQLDDGVVVLAGYSNSSTRAFQDKESDFLVIWMDGSGNNLCEFRYGTKGRDILNSATVVDDQGIILGGYSTSKSSSGYDYNLVKIDRYGATTWKHNLGNVADEYLANISGISSDGDGGFLVYGNIDATTWNMKFDKDGNKVWMDPAVNNIFAKVEE